MRSPDAGPRLRNLLAVTKMVMGQKAGGQPSRVALYHALAFLRYDELTRKPLWLATGRDLVGAVCAAIEVSTGNLHTGPGTSHDNKYRRRDS